MKAFCFATLKSLLEKLSKSAVELAKLTKETEVERTQFAYGQEQIKIMYSQKMEKLAKVTDSEKVLRDLNRQINSAKTRLHDTELSISQLQLLIEDCKNKIDELKKFPALSETPTSFEDLNDIEGRIKNIISELEKIGAVNPNAPQEFEELNNRYEFLKTQLDDLQTAKDNLQSLIAEMDEKIVTQFIEAFGQIQIYFSEVFVKLFGGGTAQLELTDKDDVLNTGVEIMVTLPNKKRQPLSVLSGGERALTVIALLFSFLKFRPSPFCILDEIDAPLDEANLLRFGNFLREFSANTQFILITHRKTTMEFLDTIYGITIEEAGVSKILSVKLNDVKN